MMMQPLGKMPAFDKIPAFAQGNMDAVMKSVTSVSKTAQTAGIEWNDFTKQSIALGTETLKKLAQAKSPQTAMEIQMAFMKESYERFMAQAKVMGGLYTGLTQEMAKPAEILSPAKLPATN